MKLKNLQVEKLFRSDLECIPEFRMEEITEQGLDEAGDGWSWQGMTYQAGYILRRIDPTAFQECVRDEIDYRTKDGWTMYSCTAYKHWRLYRTEEVEAWAEENSIEEGL